VLEAPPERDLLVSAQTGSGKTVAFGLALAPRLLGEAERFDKAGAPRALIVTPTRELAQQVHRELAWLYAETGARLTTCVGGMDPRREQHALSHGVHIVVGTPGRLCDHLERGALVLARVEAVVLDEADEMLDMGFREDLERLLDAAPAERRTLMFSATIPKPIATMAKRYQKGALRIAATAEGDRHRDIEYHAIPIVPRERDLAVVNLLRYHDAPGALVFCATRDGVTHLAANLSERGFSVAALSGELSQRERNQALQALRDGRARVCVATDVAARGLDLPDLGLVIHADLPQNAQVLVHRSGRTGRAGKHGLAILIVADNARRYVERMLNTAKIEAKWRLPPSADDIHVRDQDQLVLEIRSLAEEPGDEDRRIAQTLLAERSAEALVAALVRSRRDARPAPEELTVPPSMRPRGPDRPQRAERVDRRRAQQPFEGPDRRKPRPERPERPERSERAGRPERPERGERPQRPERGERRGPMTGNTVWFTVNVGRSKHADPKWLIPLLCRRGNVTKQAIGKIQILTRETRVEIASDAADRFAEAVRRPDPKDPRIHIEPLEREL
jgi:ATP-dependent RNA helicase DeaD